jgi:hypothetical protein
MAMSKRERYIFFAVAAAVSIFVLDRLILTPYADRRRELVQFRQENQNKLADVKQVLGREQRLRKLLVGMGGSVRSDPSQAEGQVMHLLSDWERQAGVAKASFQRVRSVERYGYTHLTFHVSATGRIVPIATLLYLVETASVPMRIDELEVLPRGEGGEELQVQFSVSTLCRKAGANDINPRNRFTAAATGGEAR